FIVTRDMPADGRYWVYPDGKFAIGLNERLFDEDQKQVSHVLRHALSHEVDRIAYYSLSERFDVPLTELFRLYQRAPAGGIWNSYLEYPFHPRHQLDTVERRAEAFAQIHAMWMTERGRDLIQRDAPMAAAFLRSV